MADEETPRSPKLAAARERVQARAAGRAAGRVGRPRSECPYDPLAHEEQAREWLSGHREGREERHAEGTALPEKRRARNARRGS